MGWFSRKKPKPPPFHPEHPPFEPTQTGTQTGTKSRHRTTTTSMPPPPPGSMTRQKTFKPVEVALIGAALLTLSGSLALYFSGVTIRKHVLGWEDEEGSVQVGKLGVRKGVTLRQVHNGTEFNAIPPDTPLFNHDTIMTSASGGATILLDDGGQIELGPDTLVKLQFESALAGLNRSAKIEVVSGTVSGQAGKSELVLKSKEKVIRVARDTIPQAIQVARPASDPRSAPVAQVPLDVRMISPQPGARLAVQEFRDPLQLVLKMEWNVAPADAPIEILLRKSGDATTPPEDVLHRVVSAIGQKGSTVIGLRKPGRYEWEVRDPRGIGVKGGPSRGEFMLSTELRFIQALPPLINGKNITSNVYQGETIRDPKVTFRWKPLPSIEKYRVRVSNRPDLQKPMLDQEVRDDHHEFQEPSVLVRKLYYQIAVPLPTGFVLTSGVQAFSLSFLPPGLVSPTDKEVISRKALTKEDNSILLTWQRTNFTDHYELEVSTDPAFSKPWIQQQTQENFYLLKLTAPGRLWWRVRSASKGSRSPFSAAHELSVVP